MKILLIVLLTSQITSISALEKAIYGSDDRVSYSEVSPQYRKLGDATAGMIQLSKLNDKGRYYEFSSKILGELMMGNQFRNGYVCSDEKFYAEELLPVCSGFLVGPDTLLTAGHCVTGPKSCKKNIWSFGLGLSKIRSGRISKKDAYKCERVIKRGMSPRDFALIKLDRVVSGVTPFRISSRRERVGDKVFAIGHPSNLPLKFAMNGSVKSRKKDLFKTDLDTFAGNSGSPVILKSTHEVIGILVKGALDYEKDLSRGCFITNKCSMYSQGADCLGESVTPTYRLLSH
ncbi:serine protease [Halobacteriovorax sp.]|uniref:trypsin-like serine peptidase n=1 Tax=Halobacteriovorax sp. TaxID=2020862 RepID=UPI0035696E77